VTILEWVFIASFSLSTFIYIIYKYKQRIEDSVREKLKDEINSQANNVINYNMRELEKIVSEVPEKVLKSITSSSNVKKGALGELIGYVELKANYDRIIPLGNIVDFIGIKFDKETEEGYIDFIDVKTGKSARLSKDQKALQQLVTDKKINFVKVKVESETRS